MPFVQVGGGTFTLPHSIYPLTVSGRWVNKATGAPFYINGDAGWSLPVNIPTSEVQVYLADRAAKGVSTVLLSMIEHKFTDQTPSWRNRLGDDPFTATVSAGNPDFTTPNEAYWSHVDYVITLAGLYGITVFAAPCYIGFDDGGTMTEGWASVVSANGTTRMTTYGTFLGNRYKTFPNLIWVMGGDSSPVCTVGDLTTHYNNLATAIKAADTVHLMTAHPAPGSNSTTSYNQSWLDIVAAYPSTNTDLSTVVKAAYQLGAAKPIFMIEGQYGNEHTMTDNTIRIQAYQSVLGGGLGHIYGQDPTWYFGVNAGTSANSTGFPDTAGVDWRNIMSNYGASFLTYVRRLQAARPLNVLIPDYGHTVVTAGFGTLGAITYAPVVANSNCLVAYTNGVALTVDKSQFTSATFNVNWYNVRDGSTTAGTATAFGSGSTVFTPPTTGAGNDWVLLCDNPSLSLGNP
jgi:hypothetical protein